MHLRPFRRPGREAPRPRRFAPTLAISAILAATALGCSPAEQASPDRPRNLIVITVDTLRADHMSLYGYGRQTTPKIDAFARTATTFDRAIAPWPR